LSLKSSFTQLICTKIEKLNLLGNLNLLPQ
jgi:hypothetical protein